MSVSEKIAAARAARGLTQQQLAERIFVTRQAVSRWERGETYPSVDTCKLVAAALDVPVVQLLDLPREEVCQCCGTPFSVPHMPRGTEADDAAAPDYCVWCYHDGAFAASTMDEVIEQSAPHMAEATGISLDEAVSYMGAYLPTLGRWCEGR